MDHGTVLRLLYLKDLVPWAKKLGKTNSIFKEGIFQSVYPKEGTIVRWMESWPDLSQRFVLLWYHPSLRSRATGTFSLCHVTPVQSPLGSLEVIPFLPFLKGSTSLKFLMGNFLTVLAAAIGLPAWLLWGVMWTLIFVWQASDNFSAYI